jgi:hypothetical protein
VRVVAVGNSCMPVTLPRRATASQARVRWRESSIERMKQRLINRMDKYRGRGFVILKTTAKRQAVKNSLGVP